MGSRPLSHLTCGCPTLGPGIPQLEGPPAWCASSLVLWTDEPGPSLKRGDVTEFTRLKVERRRAPRHPFAGVLDFHQRWLNSSFPWGPVVTDLPCNARDTGFLISGPEDATEQIRICTTTTEPVLRAWSHSH